MNIEIIYFRLLKKSGIFRYWYKKHLSEVLFDLELLDLKKDQLIDKYTKKLEFFK